MVSESVPLTSDSAEVINQPLKSIVKLFAHAASQGIDRLGDSDFGVSAYFEGALSQPGLLEKIPCIHLADCNMDLIRPDSLVRFRGMVQDMFNPEYYVSAYKEPGQSEWTCNRYTDLGAIPSDSAETSLSERRVFVCVPVPGETSWLQAADKRAEAPSFPPSSAARPKRGRGGDSDDDVSMSVGPDSTVSGAGGDVTDTLDSKRARPVEEVSMIPEDQAVNAGPSTSAAAPTAAAQAHALSQRRCLVKLYGSAVDLKLNEVAEFIGVLSCDPAAATFGQGTGGPFLEEEEAHNPPPSQVPRLHAVLVRRAAPHPALGPEGALPSEAALTELRAAAPGLREAAVTLLANCVGGDALTGELLLLHALSRIHTRIEPIVLGGLALSVVGVGKAEVAALTAVLQALLPRVVSLPLSIDRLNSAPWVPRKDYDSNVLVAGPLQAADGTELILDETALETGTLTQVGLTNLNSLKEVIQAQRVEYDFQFYQMGMNTDLRVLTLCERKSLLPSDLSVRIAPSRGVSADLPPPEALSALRNYLGVAGRLFPNISEDVTKIVEEDVVSARQEDQGAHGQEVLHRWLIVARLVAQSLGEAEVTCAHWRHMRELERRVQERMRVC